MNFSFVVGVNKQHRIDFSFDQFVGHLEIKVDGQTVIKDFRIFSLKLTMRYELTVGTSEQHSLVIEKKRKLFFAGTELSLILRASESTTAFPFSTLRRFTLNVLSKESCHSLNPCLRRR